MSFSVRKFLAVYAKVSELAPKLRQHALWDLETQTGNESTEEIAAVALAGLKSISDITESEFASLYSWLHPLTNRSISHTTVRAMIFAELACVYRMGLPPAFAVMAAHAAIDLLEKSPMKDAQTLSGLAERHVMMGTMANVLRLAGDGLSAAKIFTWPDIPPATLADFEEVQALLAGDIDDVIAMVTNRRDDHPSPQADAHAE